VGRAFILLLWDEIGIDDRDRDRFDDRQMFCPPRACPPGSCIRARRVDNHRESRFQVPGSLQRVEPSTCRPSQLSDELVEVHVPPNRSKRPSRQLYTVSASVMIERVHSKLVGTPSAFHLPFRFKISPPTRLSKFMSSNRSNRHPRAVVTRRLSQHRQ
jgi:hypothetical protein